MSSIHPLPWENNSLQLGQRRDRRESLLGKMWLSPIYFVTGDFPVTFLKEIWCHSLAIVYPRPWVSIPTLVPETSGVVSSSALPLFWYLFWYKQSILDPLKFGTCQSQQQHVLCKMETSHASWDGRMRGLFRPFCRKSREYPHVVRITTDLEAGGNVRKQL